MFRLLEKLTEKVCTVCLMLFTVCLPLMSHCDRRMKNRVNGSWENSVVCDLIFDASFCMFRQGAVDQIRMPRHDLSQRSIL